MDYKKILLGVLSGLFKLDNGAFAERFENSEDITEDAVINDLLNLDAERVQGFNTKASEQFKQGYAKAKKEERSEYEKEIAAEFGIEENKMGLDLVRAIIEKNSKGGKATNLTDDEVKKHPVYQQLEQRRQKELQEIENTWSNKYNELETGFKKQSTYGQVKAKASSILNELNPVLPTNERAKQNQINSFLAAFNDYDFDLQNDNILILKDGKVYEDRHGNTIRFEDYVKDLASGYFDFKANNGGNNSTEDDNDGNGPATGFVPKSIEELAEYIDRPDVSPEDKAKASENFDKANA